MTIIGLTGGIGSGKSTVGKILESYGMPLYNSDLRARQIMNESPEIIRSLKKWYGEEIYVNNLLDRKKLGAAVFADREQLTRLNKLVHPIVFKDFDDWVSEQNTDFIVKEAAILLEVESHTDCDAIITISAPEELRIKRVMDRDDTTRQLVLDRMSKQWTDEEREAKSDYILHNDGNLADLEKQVKNLYITLKERFTDQ
ncbi:dephospho-CoA kinase [Flavobacteriaceae bacterium Ap0902]|nr:dephospho-CoA kinase [Flavobacteriaceae bacterium Ap0902]